MGGSSRFLCQNVPSRRIRWVRASRTLLLGLLVVVGVACGETMGNRPDITDQAEASGAPARNRGGSVTGDGGVGRQ